MYGLLLSYRVPDSHAIPITVVSCPDHCNQGFTYALCFYNLESGGLRSFLYDSVPSSKKRLGVINRCVGVNITQKGNSLGFGV